MGIFKGNIEDLCEYDGSLSMCEIPDTYTVVGMLKIPYKCTEYIVKCSVCSNSKYYKDKLFSTVKSSLKNGNLCCSCSKKLIDTEDVILRKIADVCTDKKLTFLGFVGKYQNKSSRLNLKCDLHTKVWDVSVESFLRCHTGCMVCGWVKTGSALRKPDNHFLNTFKVSDADFKKLESDKWQVHCKKCGKTYKSTSYHLQEGKRGCRCTNSYKRNKEETAAEITSILNRLGTGLKFKSFTSEKHNTACAVSLECSECNSILNRSISSILNFSVKCDCKRRGGNISFAYISCVKDNNTPIAYKYGIETVYNHRAIAQNRVSPMLVERLITFKFTSTTQCRHAERDVKDKLGISYLSRADLPDGFTETVAPTYENFNKIVDIFKQFNGYEYYME